MITTRFRVLSAGLAGILAVAALAVGLRASGPAFWTVASSTDLLKGTSDGVFVSLDGVVTPGPRLTSRLTSTPAQVWSLVTTSDGTIWAGTGGDGRVIRLRPGQPEETVLKADEDHVFALAAAGTRVYAATSPDGRVSVIDGSAQPRVFFDPAEKYIWALAVDGAGRLWVGTGHPAVIYRVDPSGTSQVVYRPPADHVVSLVMDRNGRMLAGTDNPGRVYRFDAADRPFVLLDAGNAEMRGLAVASDGTIFAAAIGKSDSSSSSEDAPSVSVSLASTSTASSSSSGSTSSSTPTRRSSLYRIAASGMWEQIWSTDDVIYDLAAEADGSVLVASGPDGRLYRVTPRRDVLLLTGVDARQITRFAVPGSGTTSSLAFATANPGRIEAMATASQSPATYTSPVHDTDSVSTWGLIRWESTGTVALSSRTGNTEKPDDSWSEWSASYSTSSGTAITSPTARFIQWRAVLTTGAAGTPAPSLTSVTVAYLPRNNRPTVTSITTSPPGVVFQRPFSSEDGAIAGLDDAIADARRPPGDLGPTPPAPGRRMYQKGLQTISWKAEDADNDHLAYRLQYRRDGEQTWHDLRDGLADTIFVWDTTAVADGRYIVRVLASDSPSNAAARALEGQRDSEPIVIDNTPPVVTTRVERQGTAARLVVDVHDALSPIQKLEYSVDGGTWQIVYPVDGVADAPDERYEIPLASESAASHMVVRATDLLQNITSRAAGGH